MSYIRLIAIAKNEAAYLTEWIHHHLYYGFNEITIILNECSDNSHELLSQISLQNPSIYFRNGDELKVECQKKGIDFQREAYKQELENVRGDAKVTHLMFLDIDEFWITTHPSRSIHHYINLLCNADSISFTWHLEFPTDNKPFDRAIKSEYKIQKNPHVKSLHRISNKLIFIDIHNAIHIDGVYLLSDGQAFPEYSHNNSPKAGIPENLFKSSVLSVDEAFIYHRIFRSQVEYLATLHRGRPGPYSASIKTNRWGYITDDSSIPVLSITHQENFINELYKSYESFLIFHKLEAMVNTGKYFTLQRYKEIVEYAKNSAHEIQQHEQLFAGVTDDYFINNLYPYLVYHIDCIKESIDNLVIVTGWVGDKRSQKTINIESNHDIIEIEKIERTDVTKHYPLINKICGFSITIRPPKNEELLTDILIKFSHSIMLLHGLPKVISIDREQIQKHSN